MFRLGMGSMLFLVTSFSKSTFKNKSSEIGSVVELKFTRVYISFMINCEARKFVC